MGLAIHSSKFLILQPIIAAAIVHIHHLQEVIRQVLPAQVHQAVAAARHQEAAAAVVVAQVVQAEVATKIYNMKQAQQTKHFFECFLLHIT